MNDANRLEQLRKIPMLATLPDDALELVAARASDFEAPAGQVLVQQHSPGTGVFILAAGRATVELGSRTIDAGPGECIGELSLLLDDVVHVARVRAATDVRGIAISRKDFTELLDSDARIAGVILRVLARRLVATDDLLATGS